MKDILNPKFDELDSPETINSHIEELLKPEELMTSSKILTKLLEQFEPLDFEALAFPKVEKLRKRLNSVDKESDEAKDIHKELNKIKLNTRHYTVLAIDNILDLAKQNNWGLCKRHNFNYLYNAAFWEEIDKDDFQRFLGQAAEQMQVPKFAAKYYQFRDHLFKQFLSEAHLPILDIPKDKVLINLKNGTFEITPKGNKLRAFDSLDFLTYQLPFEYNPKAKAPIFEAYLNKVLPDKERQQVLAEFLGFVFIKNRNVVKEEKALILYGTGANGKSVFFEVVNALLGEENTSNYSLSSLTNDNGYYRAKIANKLVNYGSEINGKLESSIFKQLTSGEPIEARLPYGEPFTLKQYAKLIFNCNELPKNVEHTNGFFRRFLIIPFDVTIPEQEQDKQLHSKIIDKELSGVFNWVLEGLTRLLQAKRFTQCNAAQEALEQYKLESDPIKMFLEDMGYTKSLEFTEPLQELYKEYRSYSIDNGYQLCASRTFSKRLKSAGYQVTRKNKGMVVYAEKKVVF
ncbi:MAG: DNA primase [Aureispira sp.]|nr:DNA primase [Aureispira sp.]